MLSVPYTNVMAETNNSTKVKKISLNKSNFFLELDQSSELTVAFNPINSEKQAVVVWTSTDSKVVTVDNGTVHAKGLGTAYVYASCGKTIAFCKVTVVRYNPVRAAQNKNYIGYSGTDLEVVTKAVDIIEKNIKAGMSDEEKIKAIHGYLLGNCDFYNLGLHNAKKSYYGLVGTLLDKTAVSQGYAYTFKYFMDILGIQTRIVEHKSFMWNQISLYGRWYAICIPIDELSYRNTELHFDPEHSNMVDDRFPDLVILNEVNFEYILSDNDKDTYSGNEAAISDYSAKKTSTTVQNYTVILNLNFPYSKQYTLVNSDNITELVQDKDYYIPNNLPYIKNNNSIYVSSLNTRPDGTGVSYPNNFVKGVEENLYLYCIWDAQIEQVTKLNITGGKGSINGYWEKVSGCKDYELRYSTSSSMKNAIIKKISGQKVKISELKQKTTHYVQIRGYIKGDNGKIIYGNWSMKEKVVTK
jgi:hypothetical protein